MHMKKQLKGNQIENAVKAAKKGADKLKERNEKLSLFYSTAAPAQSAASAQSS